MTEYAWVIEHGDSEVSAPKYWAAGSFEPSNSYAWTSNHEQAIRFAREIDARRVAERIMRGMDVRVCEHGWDAPARPDPWFPIETAPKDGKPFLAYVPIDFWIGDSEATPDGDLMIVWWEARGQWTDDRDLPGGPKPTLWQPLPALPKGAAA